MPISAGALAHLHRLLGYPEDTPIPASLSIYDLQVWKPLAEHMARARKLEASEIAGMLIEVAESSGDQACLAYSHWICGNIYHNLGLIRQANEAYGRASVLYAQLEDPLNAARMSVGWVHVLGELGQSEDALGCAQRAEEVLRASGDATDESRLANLYGNRGIVYEQMGHLVDALADYKRKLTYLQNLPDRTPEAEMDEALVLNDIGVTHTLLGQYNDAEAIFQTALVRLSSNVDRSFTDADRTLVLMNVAWLKVLRQSPPAIVRRAFQQARASRDRLVEQSERLFFAHIELDEANYLIHNGRWQDVDQASITLLRDQLIQQRVEFETAYANLLLGQIDYHGGLLEQALAVFEQVAVDCTDKTPTLAYLAYLWEARALRASGDVVRAERALSAAVTSIEQTRRRLTLDDFRAGFLEDKRVAYQDMLDLYLARGAYDKALAVSEHSKARTLTEAITSNVQMEGAPADPDEIPASGGSWFVESFSVARFAETLPMDTLVISYVEVHDRVWAFLIGAQGMVAPPLEIGGRLSRADLENGLQKIQRIAHERLFTVQIVAEQTTLAQNALKNWWASFLAPLQPWLDRYARVLIAPDGLMNALPFAGFYDEANQRYFCETHEITLTPSLALWSALSTQVGCHGSAPAKNVLVVGNSSKDGVPGALPATVPEAHAVARLFASPTLLTERSATVEQFIRAAPHADLIYIAAHGEYHMGEPASSFIELVDGRLCVRDILTLRLSNPIVILNACDTSRGYLLGNEMMGLVRSFFFAGASAIVAAQWQVDDVAASELMTQIMHEVLAGCSLAQALQRAQQQFIHRIGEGAAHPFFWGSFSITGIGKQP